MPGQSDGENKKEQLAVTRQPRASPALLWLRIVDGCEKMIEDAIDATASVISSIGNAPIVGAVDSKVEASIVVKARMNPLIRVKSASPAEQISGDAAVSVVLPDLVLDHGVDPESGADVFGLGLVTEAAAKVGKGGGSTSIETVSAR